MLYIWDPPIRKLPKIRLTSFLYEGTISQKNQPEVSYKVVFYFAGSYCSQVIHHVQMSLNFSFNL